MITISRGKLYSSAVIGVVDQTIGAVTHFSFSILIARYLGADSLGEFALGYAVLLLYYMLHNALVSESYSVTKIEEQQGSGAAFTLLVMSVLGFSILYMFMRICIYYFGQYESGPLATVEFAIALFVNAVYWNIRPIAYKEDKGYLSLIATSVYSFVIISMSFYTFYYLNASFSPFLILAAGSFSALSVIILLVRNTFSLSGICLTKDLSFRLLKYGRWAVPSALLIWVINNGYYVVLPFYTSMDQVGEFKMVLNLLLPIGHILNGLSLWMLPWISKMFHDDGESTTRSLVNRLLFDSILFSMLFSIGLVFIGDSLLILIYGESNAHVGELLTLAVYALPILWAFSNIIRTALRAFSRPTSVLMAYSFAVLPIGLLIILMSSKYGANGALIGTTIIQFLVATFLAVFFYMKQETNN